MSIEKVAGPLPSPLLPLNSFPDRNVQGEWGIIPDDSTLALLHALPHKTANPNAILVNHAGYEQIICILRWGRKNIRVELHSPPADSFPEALKNVCEAAASVPAIPTGGWNERLKERLPHLALPTATLHNTVPVGRPRYCFAMRQAATKELFAESAAFEDVDAAFEDFVRVLTALPVRKKTTTPNPRVSDCFEPFADSLANLETNLTTLAGVPVTVRLSGDLVAAPPLFLLKFYFLDPAGHRHFLQTTPASSFEAAALNAHNALQIVVCKLPKKPASCLLRQFPALRKKQITITYKGNPDKAALHCEIVVDHNLTVKSDGCPSHLSAFLSASRRLEKLLQKVVQKTEPDTAQAMLDRGMARWKAEHRLLLQGAGSDYLLNERLQIVSRYLALLDPLRKYEIDPSNGGAHVIQRQMLDELQRTHEKESGNDGAGKSLDYLGALMTSTPLSAGDTVKPTRQLQAIALRYGETAQAALEFLHHHRHLGLTGSGDYWIAQKGVDLLATALRGTSPNSIAAALDSKTVQALAAIIRNR